MQITAGESSILVISLKRCSGECVLMDHIHYRELGEDDTYWKMY